MTAINMFVQGASAFMVTDGALTDFDGVLVAVENKVLDLPAQAIAICTTGWHPNDPDADQPWGLSNTRKIRDLEAVGLQRDTSHRDALRLLPALLRRMHDDNLQAFADRSDARERSSLIMTVAAYDPDEGVAKTFLASTEPLSPGHPAYELARVHHYVTASSELDDADTILAKVGKGRSDLSDPARFDARHDGLRLLNAQRSIQGGGLGLDFHSVGGRAYLTEVSAAGVTIEEFHAWHEDRIGQPIQP